VNNKTTTIEEPFLVKIVRWAVYLSLLTPLVVSGKFFFPYVGPKGIFFMALAQIAFFAWAYLAINYEQYRPTLNSVLISSTFKFKKDWNKFFASSLVIGMVVSVIYFLARFGVDMGIWAAKKGSSLGNSSFLGTYLLFNVYLALLLFVRTKGKQFLRYLAVAGFLINGAALLMSSAQAARLSSLGGLFLIGTFYLIFKNPKKRVKVVGAVILLLATVGFVAGVFHPESPLHKSLVNRLGAPRFVVWRMAWDGFKAKPLLGWGSNNFIMVYSKFFDPYKKIAGGAPWFDRAHNIVMNYLATTGILGLLSYLSMYAAAFYILSKRYLQKKKFWIPAIITAFMIAYFVHLLTVFDMPVSYMMFFLLLGFVASYKGRPAQKIEAKPQKIGVGVVIALLFLVSFWSFIVKPTQAGTGTIKAIQTVPNQQVMQQVKQNSPNQVDSFLKSNSQKRIGLYKQTLNASPIGKYQIRNFFAQHSRNFVRNNSQSLPQETAKEELQFTINKLEESKKESPHDLKTLMNLIQGYAVYSSYEQGKMQKVKDLAKEATEIAPNHQFGYWVLAQVYAQDKEFDKALDYAKQAVQLQPLVSQSQLIYIQTAAQAGKMELAREQAQKAVELIPSLEKQLKPFLSTSSPSMQIETKNGS